MTENEPHRVPHYPKSFGILAEWARKNGILNGNEKMEETQCKKSHAAKGSE